MSGDKANSKTNANKGNNFPYQIAVLQILGAIEDALSGPASPIYPAGNLLTSVVASGADRTALNTDIISKLATIGARKVFHVSSPAVDPLDINTTFVTITYFI